MNRIVMYLRLSSLSTCLHLIQCVAAAFDEHLLGCLSRGTDYQMSFTESLVSSLKLSHICRWCVLRVCASMCLAVHWILGINIVCQRGGTHASRWQACSPQRPLSFFSSVFAQHFHLFWGDRTWNICRDNKPGVTAAAWGTRGWTWSESATYAIHPRVVASFVSAVACLVA